MTDDPTLRVYHNVARDEADRPVGMLDGYQPGHAVALVARLTLRAPTDLDACDIAFRLFNVGDDPEFGPPDARAVEYRQRGNRSLSTGDVVAVNGRFYACARVGWTPIEPPRIDHTARYGTAPLDNESQS